ncbi:uncharacterized protein P174DRAFT_175402 [Aspergillus novofumigatus IBT 16806]|uniref:Uncharacterized protein n=1 Tax=Aspergillus novofumigatus (strain IBT 16806) TaxID=1392255 RepID=A0A2I1C962_ASPN1|nr:uncharacterized protein P174DRAFT_175402 [Aspergillus novofumigatus IBT 16806]PKX94177.1 hypothetical protein P174DRAFT_175402 [Aspergillus novofumigatus IBT 16806]
MYLGLKGQSVPLLFYCLLPAQKLPSYLLRLVSFMEAGRLSLRAERRVTRSNWTDLLWSNFSSPPPPIGSSLRDSGSFCAFVHPMIIRAAYLTSKGPASFDTRQNIQRCSGFSFLDNQCGGPYLAETLFLFILFIYYYYFFLIFRLFDCVSSCKWVYKCWDLLSLSLFPSCFPPCDTVVQKSSVLVW